MVTALLDGRFRLGVGIEDTFVPDEAPGRRPLDEYELTQHYRDWRADLELVAASGSTLLRYGFPWYRLNPEPGRYAWDWADRVVDRLAELDAHVVVDLLHYGTPQWLDNRFLNRGYPDAVAEYAHAFADRFGDRLTSYTPMNEPQITAIRCGEQGIWPPQLHGEDGYLQVMVAICRGIVSTQEAIRASLTDATFVHVEASLSGELRHAHDSAHDNPHDGYAELLKHRRWLATDLVTGRVDGVHPLREYLAHHGVTDAELDGFTDRTAPPDLLGMNFYPVWSTAANRHRAASEVTAQRDRDLAWMSTMLTTAHERYRVPVLLSETSFEGPMAERVAWLEQSLDAVLRLAQAIPVVGYVWWPLFDQIRWQYRESLGTPYGHLHRLGLVSLVEDDVGILQRRPNQLLERFRRRADELGGVPSGVSRPYSAGPSA